jgi:hypothetical protein
MIEDLRFVGLNPWFHCFSGCMCGWSALKTAIERNLIRSLAFGLPASSKVRENPDCSTTASLVIEDGLPYRSASWTLWREHRVFVP